MKPSVVLNGGCCALTLVILALSSTGCHIFAKPSDRSRVDSFTRLSPGFTGDRNEALRQTYFLISGGPECELVDEPGPPDGHRSTLKGKPGDSSDHGLAIGLEPDGYLLTVAHAVNTRVYVFGWFDGRVQVKPARLVYTNDSHTLGADLAIIKVAARVDHCATLSPTTRPGDQVFAAVSYGHEGRQALQARYTIGFAGGSVRHRINDLWGGSFSVLETDLPLWHGDSGGPLFSSSGQLLGVNSACRVQWRGFWWKRTSISCVPGEKFLKEIIDRDRATQGEPPTLSEPQHR